MAAALVAAHAQLTKMSGLQPARRPRGHPSADRLPPPWVSLLTELGRSKGQSRSSTPYIFRAVWGALREGGELPLVSLRVEGGVATHTPRLVLRRSEHERTLALLGTNGAGKTTTLRMLLGLVTPTSGTATTGRK